MIRILLLLLLAWIIAKFLCGLVSPVRRRAGPGVSRPDRRVRGGELVQDPHCGVYVPRETAVRGAEGHFFCSEACRDAFARKGA